MIRQLSLACALILPLHAFAAEALPSEVQKFIDQREGCDHMRGEEPETGDKQRARELKREMAKLCKGTDRKLAQLKKKYATSGMVMNRLNEFEPQIEAAEPTRKSRDRN
jgi:hypothetical protein